MLLRNQGLRKTWFDKCLESPHSVDHSPGDIVNDIVNTLTADEKYYLVNTDNLTQHIQMVLSKKQKTYSECFSASLKFRLNFEHFRKKDDSHS